MTTGQHGGKRPGAGRPVGARSGGGYAHARERRELATAALRETELARMRRELLPRDGVVRAATEAGAAFRQAAERVLSLGTELAAESDPVRIRARLEAVLRDALNEAAERLERLGGGEPDGRS